MKLHQWLIVGLMGVVLGVVGCTKNAAVSTAPLENSFKAAEPAVQSSADQAVSAIKAGDYSGALVQLQTLAKNAKLTPEQQQAIKDVVAQVQKVIADTASKAASEAGKTASDLQKSLPK
jgi:hypothetical protein